MSENAYKQAGVDVEAGYESVRLIKDDVKKTAIEGVLGGIGGFGGLFEMPKNYENPVLVSGTDGVGTKIRVAFLMDKHDTIGQDCVAMCVNDIACSGAKPLFFLDYSATRQNTAVCNTFNDLCNLFWNILTDCDIVKEEQRLCTNR